MRLFKRAPMVWCGLGLATIASDLVFSMIPGVGEALGKVISPVIECGLLIGAAALDHDEPLRLRHIVSAFNAKPSALAAIVSSSLLVFAAEAVTAYVLGGVNLLDPGLNEDSLPTSVQVARFVAGGVATLPVAFVPFAVLFEGASFPSAYARSWRGFLLNVGPLLLFASLAAVLIFLGLLSFGVGLVAVFPLLSTASYAAWKDIYAASPRVALV